MSDLPPNPSDDTSTGDAAFDLVGGDSPQVVPKAVTPDAAAAMAKLRERVYATMLKRHTLDPQLAWTLLLGGAMILLTIGFFFAFGMKILGLLLFDDPLGFKVWFFIYLVALVPFLIWQERRTRNGFFTLAQSDVDLTRDPENIGEFLLNRSKANASAIIDGLMWAPRALLAGFRAIRGIRETGLDIVLPEAADVLTLMLSLDGGVKIKALAPPGQDPMQLMPTLKWLDTHDYIGISTRGDKVWVSSFAKKRLAADHGEMFAPKVMPAER